MSAYSSEISGYVDFCRYNKSLSANTCLAYTNDLAEFSTYLNRKQGQARITHDITSSYNKHLRDDRALSAATRKRHLATLRGFVVWLIEVKHVGWTMPIFPKVKLGKRLPKVLPRDDVKRLFGAARTSLAHTREINLDDDCRNFVNLISVTILTSTGLRISELTGLQISDWNSTNQAFRVHGKGNRERIVYINNTAATNLINSYVHVRKRSSSQSTQLLLNFRNNALSPQTFRLRLSNLANQAKTSKHITPHMLRHTAATLLLEEGLDIRYVQRLLGHSSISTTEIYTHVTDVSLRRALMQADHLKALDKEIQTIDN